MTARRSDGLSRITARLTCFPATVRRMLPSSVGCNEEHVGSINERPGPPHGDPQLQIPRATMHPVYRSDASQSSEARGIVRRDRRALDAQITVSARTTTRHQARAVPGLVTDPSLSARTEG
jgi:hypothetical protein